MGSSSRLTSPSIEGGKSQGRGDGNTGNMGQPLAHPQREPRSTQGLEQHCSPMLTASSSSTRSNLPQQHQAALSQTVLLLQQVQTHLHHLPLQAHQEVTRLHVVPFPSATLLRFDLSISDHVNKPKFLFLSFVSLTRLLPIYIAITLALNFLLV
jgi:hypothetical protein